MLKEDRKYIPHFAAIGVLTMLVGACDGEARQPPATTLEGASPEIQAAFRRGYEKEFSRGYAAGIKDATKSGCTVKQMFGRE
jgi:hypothetical protein